MNYRQEVETEIQITSHLLDNANLQIKNLEVAAEALRSKLSGLCGELARMED